ncbi:MAG: SDR family NAD(P)-dependent oxidoreductase [Planctomycetota bacterium]
MASTNQPNVVVVTGASRGIGRSIAEALAADGHRLVLTARDATKLEVLADQLRRDGHEAVTVAADLRAPHAVGDVLEACQQAFGEPDAIVSNAGTAPSDKIENTTNEMLAEAFSLHVSVPLAFARACAPKMKARGSGCLLQLASTAGLRGYRFTSAYTAAKHGMGGLARALHEELSFKGIDVYAVCPGFVETDITRGAAAAIAAKGQTSIEEALELMGSQNDIGRMHKPDEVAAAVSHLLKSRPKGCVYNLDREPPAFQE